MSLPRKHIAEGIATAVMVGVGGEPGVRQGDRWQFGEVYMHVAGHAVPNPSEEDLRETLSFCEDSPTHAEPIRIRERAAQGHASSGGPTVTSKHGRCYEVIS